MAKKMEFLLSSPSSMYSNPLMEKFYSKRDFAEQKAFIVNKGATPSSNQLKEVIVSKANQLGKSVNLNYQIEEYQKSFDHKIELENNRLTKGDHVRKMSKLKRGKK